MIPLVSMSLFIQIPWSFHDCSSVVLLGMKSPTVLLLLFFWIRWWPLRVIRPYLNSRIAHLAPKNILSSWKRLTSIAITDTEDTRRYFLSVPLNYCLRYIRMCAQNITLQSSPWIGVSVVGPEIMLFSQA